MHLIGVYLDPKKILKIDIFARDANKKNKQRWFKISDT